MEWLIMEPLAPVLCVLAFTGSYVCVWAVTQIALKRGWVAKVRRDRWHTVPVALHGGVGFVPPLLAALTAYLFLSSGLNIADLANPDGLTAGKGQVVSALFGAALLFITGLWDDVRQLRPGTKLVMQFLATSLFVYFGGVFPVTGAYPVDIALTYLWFVGVTNALNMLDNMDGLASGAAIISSATVCAICLLGSGPLPPAAVAAALLTAAHLGFWLHNKRPARIFMGDSGSLATGFLLASIAMPSEWNSMLSMQAFEQPYRGFLTLFLPAAAMCLPILDTTFVTLTRLLQAHKPQEGGCDHTSHRLVRLGFSQRRAVLALHGVALMGGAVAVLITLYQDQALPFMGLLALGVALLGGYLSHVPAPERTDAACSMVLARVTQGVMLRGSGPQMLLDAVLVVTCFWGAYLLRFDFSLAPFLKDAMLNALPLVVACSILGLRLAGAYGRSWRLASAAELPTYGIGAFIGTALSLAIAALFERFGEGYSRSAFVMFGFLFFIAVSLSRLGFSILDSMVQKGRHKQGDDSLPVLIYGAGRAGKFLSQEIATGDTIHGCRLLGFVDDNPSIRGTRVNGFVVRSPRDWLRIEHRFMEGKKLPEVWISSRYVPDEKALDFAGQFTEPLAVKRQMLYLKDVE